jgi:hypothetical protein
MAEITTQIEWNSRLEVYFSSTGEKAHALSWCHKRAQERYSALKNYIDLPVIILGVLNGSVSIGSQSLFGDSPYASVAVGVIALITAILSTVVSYFKWAARAESHRIAALSYAKLYRFLAVQCSLPRHERMTPTDLLKFTKDAYDRMEEIAPLIPPEVVAAFRHKFDKPEYKELSRPEDCNGLEHIEIYSTHEIMSPARVDVNAPRTSAAETGFAVGHESRSGGTGVSDRPARGGAERGLSEGDGGVAHEPTERAPA